MSAISLTQTEPAETVTAAASGASSECRMLLNVARYYGIISKIVNILDQNCHALPTNDIVQVVHQPENQSIFIYYGEIIEECLSETEADAIDSVDVQVKTPSNSSELVDNTVVAEECDISIDAIVEENSDELFSLGDSQSVQSLNSIQKNQTEFEVIGTVKKEEVEDNVDDKEMLFSSLNASDDDSNISEYYVEFLQEIDSTTGEIGEETVVQEQNGRDLSKAEEEISRVTRYRCHFVSCSQRFHLAKQYDDHIRKEHSGIIRHPIVLQCRHTECSATFNDTLKLYMHHKKHKPQLKAEKPFYCSACQITFSSKDELRKHIQGHPRRRNKLQTIKSNIKRQCEFCSEVLEPKINIYNVHCVEIHGRALYSCFVCGKVFHLMAHLSEHIKAGHDVETTRKYIDESLWRIFQHGNSTIKECRICFRLFASQKAEFHHSQLHIKELLLTCSHCGGKHYESHCTEPRPKYNQVYEKVQCEQCQRWMSKKNIKEHIATHANDRLYPCTVCRKSFKVKRTAHRHIQNHINAQNKRRKCYDCDQEFENDSLIPEHYRLLHVDRRPYNCLICGEGFFLKVELGDHSHTHSDEERRRMSVRNPVEHYQIGNARVYECTLCRRAFSAKRTTVAHFIVHTDRPFTCQYCSMSFRVKIALEDHLLDIHKVKV
ncbi:zinc finger protein 197-like [Wyeomyia smithii]|uniref:zinc finger protein 197-like n=1 Tax=Wyeomyia smithii TaxID=174621 RepID=UPI002467BB61|nr:zinc finger protein 197-like [Wyeomyia smithii]